MQQEIKTVLENIERVKRENGITYPITVVAATKTVTPDRINLLPEYGVEIAGENRVQEMNEKVDRLHPGFELHMIGALQTNKVKYLVGKATLIQSVDRDELAAEIDRLSRKKGVTSDILAEINIGREESKSGYAPEDCLAACERLLSHKNLRLKGLMAMLPLGAEESRLADLCLQMREFYDIMRKNGAPFEHLSMGMSGDYKTAIANGSNMIRIGSLIFGKRNYTV